MKKENIFKTAFLYPFRLIASIMSALSMDDKGLSLKKILALYSTIKAGQFTEAWLAPNNVIVLVLMWLIYAGVLVGIYSISDISNAIGNVKNGENKKLTD